MDCNALNEVEIANQFKLHFEPEIFYSNVELITDSKYYTLIPELFADTQTCEALLKFHHPDFESNKYVIHSNGFPALKANLIIACPLKIENAISSVFGKTNISHNIIHFLNRIETNQGIYMSVHSTNIDIAVVSENGLLLLNTYSYSSNEDILYHLLNIIYTLKLQANMRQLIIFNQQQNPALQSLLIKHIPNTTIIQSTI